MSTDGPKTWQRPRLAQVSGHNEGVFRTFKEILRWKLPGVRLWSLTDQCIVQSHLIRAAFIPSGEVYTMQEGTSATKIGSSNALEIHIFAKILVPSTFQARYCSCSKSLDSLVAGNMSSSFRHLVWIRCDGLPRCFVVCVIPRNRASEVFS